TGSPSPLPAAGSSAGRSPPSSPTMRAVGSRRRSSETMISSLARSCSVTMSWWEVLYSRARPSRSRPRRYSAAAWAAARAMSSRCGAEGTAAGGVRGAEVFILVRLARGDRPRAGGQGADGLPRLRPGSCSAQQVPQVRGHQEPVGVGGLAHAAEVLEAGVELRELAPAQPVLLAPVGAGPEGRQGARDVEPVGTRLRRVVAVRSEIHAVAAVRGGQPHVVGRGAADLEREGDAHALCLEALAQRCEGLLEALGGKRPLGLVEAHAARR